MPVMVWFGENTSSNQIELLLTSSKILQTKAIVHHTQTEANPIGLPTPRYILCIKPSFCIGENV